jgi:hypothetical protein
MPDGTTFHKVWSAERLTWSITLTVPGGPRIVYEYHSSFGGEGAATKLFREWRVVDALIRQAGGDGAGWTALTGVDVLKAQPRSVHVRYQDQLHWLPVSCIAPDRKLVAGDRNVTVRIKDMISDRSGLDGCSAVG